MDFEVTPLEASAFGQYQDGNPIHELGEEVVVTHWSGRRLSWGRFAVADLQPMLKMAQGSYSAFLEVQLTILDPAAGGAQPHPAEWDCPTLALIYDENQAAQVEDILSRLEITPKRYGRTDEGHLNAVVRCLVLTLTPLSLDKIGPAVVEHDAFYPLLQEVAAKAAMRENPRDRDDLAVVLENKAYKLAVKWFTATRTWQYQSHTSFAGFLVGAFIHDRVRSAVKAYHEEGQRYAPVELDRVGDEQSTDPALRAEHREELRLRGVEGVLADDEK